MVSPTPSRGFDRIKSRRFADFALRFLLHPRMNDDEFLGRTPYPLHGPLLHRTGDAD